MESRQLITSVPPAPTAGFTLIELLVVLLILTITIGIVSVNLGGNDTDRVRDEADRLVALLATARDEAILQGRIFAVRFQEDGYQFLHIDANGKLSILKGDDAFRPRQLPDGMTLLVNIEGAPAAEEAGLVFEPSGQIPPFVITFRLGDVRWYAVSEVAGRLRSRATPEAERAG